jgi:signal transduction histidine kinase/CheY-like chemotaxis protein
MLAFHIVSSTVLRRNIEDAERQEVRQVLRGIESTLSLAVEQFNTRFADWSDWDDTCEFMRDRSPKYIKSNLEEMSLYNLRLNLLAFVTTRDKILWASGFDLERKRKVPVPAAIKARILAGKLHPIQGTQAGLLMLPEGPMLLAARPILNSNSEGPSRGTFIVGRWLSETEVPSLARTNRVSMALYRVKESSAPVDLRGAEAHLRSGSDSWTQPVSAEEVAGYRYLSDVDGKKSIVLRTTSSRALYRRGASSLDLLLWTLVGIGVFFAGITLLFLERAVLARLARFSGSVEGITTRRSLQERVPEVGTDELGRLGVTVNSMLAALEKFELEREGANQQLRRSTAAAEAANRAKSGFLANMSHELRTPMNAIIGFAELLEDQRFGPLSEKQRRYVGNILSSGRHLLQLINDILDLSKVEAGRMELLREELDVGAAVSDVAAIVRGLATKKGIQLEVSVAPGLPHVQADPPKLKQIVYNLLSNAVKFTPAEGRVEVSVAPAREEIPGAESLLEIAVSDTGIGIPKEHQHRVFLEFEQVDSSYARQQQGTGLGLALTRKLVELHGGTIELHSEGANRGSTFRILLPTCRQEEAAISSAVCPVDSHAEGPAPGGECLETRPLVLVVDDERVTSELLGQHLTQGGYEVAHAHDGDTAVELARTLRPAAITLDVLLPKKDGWTVLATLRTMPETHEIPVVMLSITEDPGNSSALGAAAFLQHPVTREKLLGTLETALRTARRSDVTTVLVVDDEPNTVELLTATLRNHGYSVLAAAGGKDAIGLAQTRRPDAIVVDLTMPEMSGFEVIRHLRGQRDFDDVPILVCTSRDLSSEERRRLSGQVQQITTKGSGGALLHALRTLSAGGRGRGDNPGGIL